MCKIGKHFKLIAWTQANATLKSKYLEKNNLIKAVQLRRDVMEGTHTVCGRKPRDEGV